VRHDPWEALQLLAASDFTCAGAALAAPPAETLSGQIMRLNALASMKRLGCSEIESSRDPGNTPVKVLPDLVRIVPLNHRGASCKYGGVTDKNHFLS